MAENACQIQIEAKGDTAEVLVYDQIGKSFFDDGLTAKAFAEGLKGLGKGIKTINVRINSPGGSVFDGTAIYNTLRNHGAKVVTQIEGGALSIASLIAMAGDERRMAKNGYLMIHDPMSMARGRADDMRKAADMLDKVKATLVDNYADRSGHGKEEIAAMMSKETWLSATEAKELGFVDEITDEVKAVAAFDPQMFANVPVELLNAFTKEPEPMAIKHDDPKPATIKELKAACPGASADFLMAQLDAEATVADAQAAWMTKQGETIAKLQADLDAAKKAPPVAAAGVDPLPVTNVAPVAAGDFWSLVNELTKGGMPKNKAVAKVVRENPEAHKAMLAESNK